MRKLSHHQILRHMFDNDFLATAARVVLTSRRSPNKRSKRGGPSSAVRSKSGTHEQLEIHNTSAPSRMGLDYLIYARPSFGPGGILPIIIGSVLGLTEGGEEVSCKCFQCKGITIQDRRYRYLSSFLGGVICKYIRWHRSHADPFTNFLAAPSAQAHLCVICERLIRLLSSRWADVFHFGVYSTCLHENMIRFALRFTTRLPSDLRIDAWLLYS